MNFIGRMYINGTTAGQVADIHHLVVLHLQEDFSLIPAGQVLRLEAMRVLIQFPCVMGVMIMVEDLLLINIHELLSRYLWKR